MEEPIKVTSHFVARVVVFNINFPLTQGYPLVFHLKSYNEPCVLKKLISLVNKATGEGRDDWEVVGGYWGRGVRYYHPTIPQRTAQ